MRLNRLTLPLVPVLVLALATSATAWDFHGKRIEGSGDLETRILELDEFTGLNVGGSFEVDIRLGDEQRVEVTVDDNLWDNLEVDVRRGVLSFGWDESCEPDDDCRIEIVVRALDLVEIHGAADVDISDYRGGTFKFRASGAADLDIDGEVDHLDIKVSGAAEIDARRLQAKHVKVRISGAADADLTATESIDAEVSGVGNIDYWGDPEKKKTRISGLGSIDAH